MFGIMSSLSAHTDVQNNPTGKKTSYTCPYIFATLTMTDDPREVWHWVKHPEAPWRQTHVWFMNRKQNTCEPEIQTQVNNTTVPKATHKRSPVIQFCGAYTFCSAMCDIWPRALTPDFKRSRLRWCISLDLCVSACSRGHKFHRILYKWRLMLDWQTVELFLSVKTV